MNSKSLVDYDNLAGETLAEKYASLKEILDRIRGDSQVIICGPKAFAFFAEQAEAIYPTSLILDNITYFLKDEMEENYITIHGPNIVIELGNLCPSLPDTTIN